MSRSDKSPLDHPLVAQRPRNKHPNNPYPPWLLFGQAPYTIFTIMGVVQNWSWKQFLILGGLYFPYLLFIISWFIRQRKQERIIQKLLDKDDVDNLEITNNPIVGDIRYSTRPSSKSKKSSSKSK